MSAACEHRVGQRAGVAPEALRTGPTALSGGSAASEHRAGLGDRFVSAGGHDWRIQLAGSGPDLLLLHGTGSSSHSWRELSPMLARHFRVLVPDMPGHGLTRSPRKLKLGLRQICEAIDALLDRLQFRPKLAVGHSAGAAVVVRMSLDGRIDPAALVSVNGALLPLQGIPGVVFAPVARLLVANRVSPHVLAWRASRPNVVDRLVRNTGSRLDSEGVAHYRRLLRDPRHVAGALNMMANWSLASLAADLPRLGTALYLVVGDNDSTVAPQLAERVRELNPSAQLLALPGLGHLAHEERPRTIAAQVLKIARATGIETARAPEHGGGA